MVLRQPVVAGNWKMNGSRASNTALAEALAGGVPGSGVATIVCPPFCHLAPVAGALTGSGIALGAQNVADTEQGAYTGEVAGDMLTELGCRYAIVGHSERRGHYGETDSLIAARFAAAKGCGLTPILCVGESLAEYDAGQTRRTLERQIDAIFAALGPAGAFTGTLLAYEPVWAIGTGRAATPEQAQEVHAFLRAHIASRDASAARHLPILYGGSVKPDTAADLFAGADVDGGLIGGASLKPDTFLAIAGAAGDRQ